MLGEQEECGANATPRNSLGSGILSYGSGSSLSPTASSSSSNSSITMAVNECMAAWTTHINLLNHVCFSGHRLAQCLMTLEYWGKQSDQGIQSQINHVTNAWLHLTNFTTNATNLVRGHFTEVLQDFRNPPTSENDRDVNQAIILENTQSMIDLQHQFCSAIYDAFAPLMFCFVCKAPVGASHEADCEFLQRINSDARSQTPSPRFGIMNKDSIRMPIDSRAMPFGSGSTQGSSDHIRGTSPHSEIRGPSPIQGFLDNVKGPLPNPGLLISMKAPFYRGSRSPLSFPLFRLCGQRRWSEAAANEVKTDETDAESQMRRWSMPWEASKTDKNFVSWHHTRILPITQKLGPPVSSKGSLEQGYLSGNQEYMWPKEASQDGLAEAIQLLSCKPSRLMMHNTTATSHLQGHLGYHPSPLAFVEEDHQVDKADGNYEYWSNPNHIFHHHQLPSIKLARNADKRTTEDRLNS